MTPSGEDQTVRRHAGGPLDVAVERFREHQRILAAAERAERYMLAAVAQLAADGTVEERAEYVRLTQQILDENEAKRS